jgi:hypothetical protein
LFCCKIKLFTRIIGKVVKFVVPIFVIMDKLPITASNDGRWFATLIAIVGIMPEEITLSQRLLFQQRSN